MTDRTIPAHLRRQVLMRAHQCCEYCRLPTQVAFFPHEVDHVVAIKHGGLTEIDNLVLACWRCNRHKGSDLGSFDPDTGTFTFLFNPRTQQWAEHFCLRDDVLEGLTAAGRTTIHLLHLNTPERVAERRRLRESGYRGDVVQE